MAEPDPAADGEPQDSLESLAEQLAAEWASLVGPVAAQLVQFLQARPDLETARNQLAGLLPGLNTAALEARVTNGMLQARLAGLVGAPVYPVDLEDEPAFAEGGLVELKPLTDAEAVRALLDKQVGARFSFDWRDVREAEHSVSFVVAKAMKADVLHDIHEELVLAISQGWSRDRFVRELTPILQAHGWWGRQKVTDPVTGAERLAQLGSPRRIKTIFDTNMRMAHAAGRWERFTRVAQPGDMLRYVASTAARPREAHKPWYGVTLPINHLFWTTHYPPNGWHCQCTAILVLAQRLAREGARPTTDDELRAKGWGQARNWVNRRTGEIEQIPVGIDPGFAYNVGQARLRAFTPEPGSGPPAGGGAPVTTSPGRAVMFGQPASALPPPPPPRAFVGQMFDPALSPQAASDAALDLVRGRAAEVGPRDYLFTDAAQVPIPINEGLFRNRSTGQWKIAGNHRVEYLPLMLETIFQPDEIWAAFQTWEDADGALQGGWRRRYVARWTLPGARDQAMLAVFTEDGDGWLPITAFPPAQSKPVSDQWAYLDNQVRTGVLIWRRG